TGPLTSPLAGGASRLLEPRPGGAMEPSTRGRITGNWTSWPQYSEDEVAAVTSVLRSGRVSQWTGQEIGRFETEYAAHLDRRHAVVVMNGTVALELALRVLGAGPGDEVITTPRTFIATASVAVMCGATPVMADVDRDSGNIGAAEIERVLSPRTKAIIVVHLGGWPADMTAIMELARSRGVAVIEDCAQAHGALHRGRPVGSFGDIAAFSFCQDKIIPTDGKGDMLVLDDAEQFKRACGSTANGKRYGTVINREHLPGYQRQHDDFGTNWRMTEMLAALGRIQLARLEQTDAQ